MNYLDRQNSWLPPTLHRLTLVIAAGAVICLALLLSVPARSDSWPYKSAPAPFSLKIKMIDYERNSAGDLKAVETQAQRSDGATVSVYTRYRAHLPLFTFRAIELPEGTRVSLVDALLAKSTCRPKRRLARKSSSSAPTPPDCLGPADKLLHRTVLFGQTVDLVKSWDRGSGGEEWLAPALGCKELQWQTASLQPDGSRRIEAEGKLVSFSLGEPDARLFDLGASYAEVKPSELRRREMEAAGVPWTPELAEESEQQDRRYAAECQIDPNAP